MREVQQNGAVLADGIEQHRVVRSGEHLAKDVDALGFQALEMGQRATANRSDAADRRAALLPLQCTDAGIGAADSGPHLTDGRAAPMEPK